MSLLIPSINFVKRFKMKKVFVSLQSEVTMRESLKMIFLKKFVKRMVFTTIFHSKNTTTEWSF